MALATDADDTSDDPERSWRWRVFSIGGAIGLTFGAVYLLLPTVTGALLGKPLMILPIPFSDFTARTDAYLPAVATGMSWDLGNLLVGMVLPFFAMVGSFVGLSAEGGAQGVGRAATAACVISSTLILILDYFLTHTMLT